MRIFAIRIFHAKYPSYFTHSLPTCCCSRWIGTPTTSIAYLRCCRIIRCYYCCRNYCNRRCNRKNYIHNCYNRSCCIRRCYYNRRNCCSSRGLLRAKDLYNYCSYYLLIVKKPYQSTICLISRMCYSCII